ncbi:hypothetical protein IAS59_001163 [Cryptococcus gattii]
MYEWVAARWPDGGYDAAGMGRFIPSRRFTIYIYTHSVNNLVTLSPSFFTPNGLSTSLSSPQSPCLP